MAKKDGVSGNVRDNEVKIGLDDVIQAVSYTHLTLPTTERV